MITVVGIGADGMAGLVPAASAELRRATVIYGAKRQLDLLDESVTADRREWGKPFLDALCAVRDFDGDVHVVASGDPMLHGVGASLIRVCGADRVRVLPHVSSVTLACARLGWSVQDTEVISLMLDDVRKAVRRGGQAIVLSKGGPDLRALAIQLFNHGRGDSELTLLEQLGGHRERRRDGIARDWADDPPADIDDLHVIAVRYLPEGRVWPADEAAYMNDGQITKQAIRVATVAALAPRPGQRLWDVGSGSGSIAVEWCRTWPGCSAVAFERDEQRQMFIGVNASAHAVDIDVRGAAPKAFYDARIGEGGVDGVPSPSAIFIGGGLTTSGMLEACWENLPTGGRLVANAVTLESEAILVQWYSRLGGELRKFQHYEAEPLGGFASWRPARPITQWVVTKQ
ncbi:precorrin-6y C5,15-methyltransferase (decarboxylating) subunit CbiE [Mycolicibacterium aichiense]|uniref:Precorrin-6Y C(5,15)-methyltransferase [decarboxylating] n=1 Tax=Mycolicibacterium aichiense TaxID=1799 RepID=A0AAD1HML5_9MYCO|nr:precorrin-6y C5,15-methyltransferase (decarboxylating) subunit CbiE [Mycolicibacterium aichiense]MCV7020173.1 precorrin-6y C5,15-methyltransferase (decarboxylating) subunit CbiE [Mycolicibacterium aichiense]BBX07769.1 precorrin-6Y C(5,15)-methyltransferase [decarboxylating] [Mycolicibacterium aichiense]STZ81581.1 precorrin-6y C5,15-methyltransferase (decarboxylating), CbiE and CbiT subunits [Mycolicibacterium aichiense]